MRLFREWVEAMFSLFILPVAVAGAIGVIFTFVFGFVTPENTPIERV